MFGKIRAIFAMSLFLDGNIRRHAQSKGIQIQNISIHIVCWQCKRSDINKIGKELAILTANYEDSSFKKLENTGSNTYIKISYNYMKNSKICYS